MARYVLISDIFILESSIDHNKIKQRRKRAVYNVEEGAQKVEDENPDDQSTPPGCPLGGQLKREMEQFQNSALNPDFGSILDENIKETKKRYHKDFQEQ